MSEAKTPEQIEALAKRVNAMTPPNRLRLAASLMEARASETALSIIRRVADELQLAIMLREIHR